MFCHKCGTQIDDGSVFCPKCGTKVISTYVNQQADISTFEESMQPIKKNAQQNYGQPIAVQQIETESKNSKLGLFALIFSILGCTYIIGIILAIIDLCKKDGRKKTLSIIALVICGIWIVFIVAVNLFDTQSTSNNAVLEKANETKAEDVPTLTESGTTEIETAGDEEDIDYWVGEDDFKISDPSLVGRWRTYEGDTLELDEYGTAPTVFTFWGPLNGKPDSVTWEASNGCLTLSAHYSTEQRWEIRPRGNMDGYGAVTDELFLRDGDIPKDETLGEYYREHTGNEGLSGVWKSRQMLVDLILYEDGTGMMGKHMLTWEADETTFYCYPVIEMSYDYIVSGDTLTIFFSDGSRTYVKVGN